ncbi:hypothetical protein Syun_024906 [Stephania yunnanensis]|uniref:Uncharacterized protein n=1 Tax=Stephania yunnanensis TaxID=152371 RepID=A0AAP0HV98_9MAGN
MDAIFRARRSGGEGSGGKIVRGRRVREAPSPYARPPPPPPENPRWLLGFVGPATRTIASGAGRLISSLFRSDSSGSSSSSEDESSAGSSSGAFRTSLTIALGHLGMAEETLRNMSSSQQGVGEVVTAGHFWEPLSKCSDPALAKVAEAEIGSPVLVAKSYMRTRPPWGSPSLNSIGLKSPSAIWAGSPHSLGGHSFSSQFLKRKSLMDSWDALDGARRVRFKQGESIPIESSVLELERRISPASLMHEKGEVEVGIIIDDIDRMNANGALPSGQSVVISDKTQDNGGERRAGEEEVTASVANEPTVPDSVVGQPDEGNKGVLIGDKKIMMAVGYKLSREE